MNDFQYGGWNSSSLCDFHQIAVICMLLYIKCPYFVQIVQFQDGVHNGSILLPVSYLMSLQSSEIQNLSTNQISSTYLNLLLRYNYYGCGKTNVRHSKIFLPVATSTIS